MTYPEAAGWLAEFANVEQRLDPEQWRGVKLERVQRLVELLGHPERHGRTVHIAGSKGKGSVAAMVDSILRQAGLRVGLYTSPHLVSPLERIRIDGVPLSQATFTELVEQRLRPIAEAYQAAPEHGPLTYFDLQTALAFLAFEAARVDWSVLEVGLGGRLDATNVVLPDICAITSISLEHTALLGSTLRQIAIEKAGILKPGVPVVLGPQPPPADGAIRELAALHGAPALPAAGVAAVPGEAWVDDGVRPVQTVAVDWRGERRRVRLPLLGAHQVENAAVARTVIERVAGESTALDAAIVAGLEQVEWPGRLQVVGRRPWVVLDGAHTPVAAERLIAALTEFPHQRRYYILGSAIDKDFAGFAERIGDTAAGVITAGIPNNPRFSSPARLAELIRPAVARVEVRPEIGAALALAREWATAEDLIVVTGSLYLVGAALRELSGPRESA